MNGRLREKDLLKNIPTNRIIESYVYGQIHFDILDDGVDPFTSSREGVKPENAEYQQLLNVLKSDVLPKIIDDWDVLRRKYGDDGDADNKKITRKQRKSEELFNTVSNEFSLEEGEANKNLIDEWVQDLKDDAAFCFSSYAECYISENLLRTYIIEKKLELSPESMNKISDYQEKEKNSKAVANISFDIRRDNNDLSYLSMTELATLFDKGDLVKENNLFRDSREYKPLRDALMHTAVLHNLAKNRLTSVYENIKGRLRQILSSN